jgi:pyruvate kinase
VVTQVQASLIVVYTHTGQTAELVAKYRPPMPILTLVVPHLVNDGLKWKLEGRWVRVGGRVGGDACTTSRAVYV